MSMPTPLNRIWEYKVVRFFCVGCINTITDITILDILHFVFGVPILVGNLFSASIAITLSYFLNHSLVFRSKDERTFKAYLKFYAVTGISLLVSQTVILTILLHVFTLQRLDSMFGLLHTTELIKLLQVDGAKIVAVMVGMIWNYFFYHLVVFKETPTKHEEEVEEESTLPY